MDIAKECFIRYRYNKSGVALALTAKILPRKKKDVFKLLFVLFCFFRICKSSREYTMVSFNRYIIAIMKTISR